MNGATGTSDIDGEPVRERVSCVGKQRIKQLAALEKELKQRLDVHEAAIVGVLQELMKILNPPLGPPPSPKKEIGFHP